MFGPSDILPVCNFSATAICRIEPKKTKDDIWGQNVDFKDFNLEEMINEAVNSGENQVMEVKSKDSYVKISVEK